MDMGLLLCLVLVKWQWLSTGGEAKVYCCCGENSDNNTDFFILFFVMVN
jgi:hypothetical protein